MVSMRSSFVMLLVVLPFAIALGCSTTEEQQIEDNSPAIAFTNLGPEAEFVGDAACFDCHEDQYRGFQEHGMANSWFLLTQDVAVEEFGSEIVVDSTTGLHYETVASDSGYYQVEYLLDEDGNRVHELARHMEWVVGSGTTARTYMAEEDGWFYELPVTWYTQQGRWDFSPGYRIANKRFDRKIADRCVVCHNSHPRPFEQTQGMYDEMPSGIGCERCHGPGSEHVEARLVSDPPAGQADVTIVNPAHLSLELRMDVCQQCHLNGSVSLLRDGEDAYSYRPSRPLEDYVALYTGLENVQEEGISVISHAERMMKSACYTETLESPKPLECTTCHDPHDDFRTKGDSYFNVTCMNCHSGDQLASIDASSALKTHTPEANCIDCHMPKTDLVEAPHSAFTDHYIRVVGQESLEPERTESEDVLTAHFEADRKAEGDARLYEGMAYITRGFQGGMTDVMERGIAILEAAFNDGLSMSEAVYLHGYALLSLGRPAEAINSLEEAARLEPGKAERLNTLAQAYEKAGVGDPVRIERLYREALRIQPALSDVRLNLGRFLQSTGRVEAARSEYRRVADDESWNALAYYNLGTLALQEGNMDEAERWLRVSMRLDPLDGGTLSNLGLVHLQRGDIAEARNVLETAVERAPEHPEALENLGSLYLNLEAEEEAARYLERAADVLPSSADVQAKLALAYFRLDRFAAAEQRARQALAINPSHPLANQILGAL